MKDTKIIQQISLHNRLIGRLPKVGIRPTIDGRLGGIRESLESQVMAMANSTAEFISENCKYPFGMPVECVVADRCIGGVAEAALAQRLGHLPL